MNRLERRKPTQLKPLRTSNTPKGPPIGKRATTKKSKATENSDHSHVRNGRVEGTRQAEIIPSRVRHLLDVKNAIERLNIETNLSDEDSASSSSSAKSSSSLESGPSHSGHHLNTARPKHGSTTLNTTVTSADEFVWIDSHNRLVELQQLPWSPADIMKVIHDGTSDSHTDQVDPDLVPRLSYYLQRVLVRLAREAQRLAKTVGKCGSAEIGTAVQVVLSPGIAISVTRACLRSSAMFAISSEVNRHSKARRAGLIFNVGKMFQWMCLVKIGRFIHEESAVYLTAAIQCILEEILVESWKTISRFGKLCASLLERVVADNCDWWGICQPFAHLSSSRIGSGQLMMSSHFDQILANSKTKTTDETKREKNIRQILLTTCVGSVEELEEMLLIGSNALKKLWQGPSGNNISSGHLCGASRSTGSSLSAITSFRRDIHWQIEAIHALYHFMRCSQLEYIGQEGRSPIQELVYERPYMVLPPIIEWIRVGDAFAQYRSSSTIDKDDVLQAARILLPGMDCPPRILFSMQSSLHSNGDTDLDVIERYERELTFKLLHSGRRDVIAHAMKTLPNHCKNARNPNGLTSLQCLALQGDAFALRSLLDAGFNVNSGTESEGGQSHEFLQWPPLCFAALNGHVKVCRALLEFGACVEGSLTVTGQETPLQLAAAAGHLRIVELLMSHGASPFFNQEKEDVLLTSKSSNQNCLPPLSIAAAHGQRRLLHVMMTQSLLVKTADSVQKKKEFDGNEILSLAEILAEGATNSTCPSPGEENQLPNKSAMPATRMTKVQTKHLQEAMYHAAESNNLEIALDIHNFGVPWTLYCWIQCLQIAQETHAHQYINEILQDFSKEWLNDHKNYFAEEALPVLFQLFKTTKNESTLLMLADIFGSSFGSRPLSPVNVYQDDTGVSEFSPRIDPKFVNNPELSDVQFRVEGRIFYAHKLVLVTASPRFHSMLNSRFCEGTPPVLQINDIRHNIFNMVMLYLYNGNTGELHVEGPDVLELMAAANFFQLTGLLKYCEVFCSKLVDLDNIVSYYIHAKVYLASNLLNYCERFLLQNLVALLTYDDSVKRLLFGKKLQNHDVLNGLLKCLQNRLQK
ncbi:ankyrin repeat and BTB/POZ domain-containing protein 3-like [Tigriopus californicus]|nr:ankyrin repeat and BTB/POZ domain-containing protein 3-like [Tigriopus californicus]